MLVIISNVGGAAELVEQGRDGWHFERGNIEPLYRIIEMITRERSLVESIRSTIRTAKSIEENASEFLECYQKAIG